ncbi:MAG: retropepsin-like aspartic protease [Bacteroidota bacterium]
MKSLKKFLFEKHYVSIPLTFTATNHFAITAKVNGVKGRFILDTGASNTCIDMDKQEVFAMKAKSSEIKAAGAGAIDMETQISSGNQIVLGKWKRKRQKIVLFNLVHVNKALSIHDTEPVDGIIGADILKKGKAIIDYDKRRLYLKKK